MTAERTIRDFLASQARRFPKRSFLEWGENHFSFSAVDDRTDRAATALVALGLRGGERVALLMNNRPELLLFLLGAPKVGIVPVVLDPAAPPGDLEVCLRACRPSVVITESWFDDMRERFPDMRAWIAVDGEEFSVEPFQGLVRGGVLGFWPELSPSSPAAVFSRYTSGKACSVALSHRDLLASCNRLLLPFRVNESDRVLCAVPLNSAEALVTLVLVPWAAGASCILVEAHPARIVEEIVNSRATLLAGGAPLFDLLANSRSFAAADLATLRLAVCHSGPVGSKLLEVFEKRHDALVVEGFGCTEAGGLAFANPYTGVRKPGSIGRTLPGLEYRIVDDRGSLVAPHETGELLVRGEGVMRGYLEAGQDGGAVLADGWLRTGVTGFVDGDGYIFLRDRTD